VSKVARRWTRRTVVVVDMEDEAETPRYQLHFLAPFGADGQIVTASHASKHVVPSSRCIAAQKSAAA
jgi:hypothetical protein